MWNLGFYPFNADIYILKADISFKNRYLSLKIR